MEGRRVAAATKKTGIHTESRVFVYCSIETISSPVSSRLDLGAMVGDVVAGSARRCVVVRQRLRAGEEGARPGGKLRSCRGQSRLSDRATAPRPAVVWGQAAILGRPPAAHLPPTCHPSVYLWLPALRTTCSRLLLMHAGFGRSCSIIPASLEARLPCVCHLLHIFLPVFNARPRSRFEQIILFVITM